MKCIFTKGLKAFEFLTQKYNAFKSIGKTCLIMDFKQFLKNGALLPNWHKAKMPIAHI